MASAEGSHMATWADGTCTSGVDGVHHWRHTGSGALAHLQLDGRGKWPWEGVRKLCTASRLCAQRHMHYGGGQLAAVCVDAGAKIKMHVDGWVTVSHKGT